SRAKALCFLGVFAARGSDTLTRRSFPNTPVSGDKGLRGGQENEIFEEEKGEEGSFCRNEEARQKGYRQEDKEGCQENEEGSEEPCGKEGRKEESCKEESCQEVRGKLCEGQHVSVCAESQGGPAARYTKTSGVQGTEAEACGSSESRAGARNRSRQHLLH